MKKGILLTALYCLLTIHIQAQSYSFTKTTGNYSDLTGSISLNNDVPWDDPEFVIPIGFDFRYFDTVITELHFRDWGDGADLTSSASSVGIVPVLTPYGADIIDRAYDFNNPNATTGALSNISYLLEGIVGNRILKIEWKNVGFYSEIEDTGDSTNFANFQLWLYEGSNTIEMHYGPSTITDIDTVFDGESGPAVSLIPFFDIDMEEILTESATFLIGAPEAPNTFTTMMFDTFFLNGSIPNGTIYSFTNPTLGIGQFADEQNSAVFPNPVRNHFSIVAGNEIRIKKLSIVDTKGRILRTISNPELEIDASFLDSGMYFVQIETESFETLKKLIKY